MLENFDPIMQVDFTAKFEKYLDKIASGKAKWFNVLDKFYKNKLKSKQKEYKEHEKRKK